MEAAVRFWTSAGAVIGVPPQVPLVQASEVVHALPSLHAVPFALFGFEHVPVAALHTPATWH